MKLPATLIPSLPSGTTKGAAAPSGASASTFDAHLDSALDSEALVGALGGEGSTATADRPDREPADSGDAGLPAHSGPVAQGGAHCPPAISALPARFWPAAHNPAPLNAAMGGTPSTTSGGDTSGATLDGAMLDGATLDGATLDGATPGGAATALPPAPAGVPDAASGTAATAQAMAAAGIGTPQPAQTGGAAAMGAPASFPADSSPAGPATSGRPAAGQEASQPAGSAAAASSSEAPVPSPALLPASLVSLPAQPPTPALQAVQQGAQQAVPPNAPLLSEQLARPLFALAAAPLGEHVMTINVVPDALGPVTVRAHLAPDGIRIEMTSPSDAGREGLRNILVDLRRDLAAGGLAASLSMGTGTGGQDTGGGQHGFQGSGNPWGPAVLAEEQNLAPPRRPAPSEFPPSANSSLDITV